MFWLRSLCQRSRHCLPVRPGHSCETSSHERVPCTETSLRIVSSSLCSHGLRCVAVLE